mmetsp:Transcript_20639/g.48476  ORF Transcript_20639/g.48476 Transcript_20639/m.48476 type:complete len:362 (+) Transcript_20639:175-1260(+)
MKVSFPELVAINERKRRVELRNQMICSSWPVQNRSRKRTRRSSGFVCGTVAKPVGSNAAAARSAKSRVLKRINKNDSVLHKHQKWLHQLQEKRRQLEERKKADAERQLERRKAFMEREAKKRLDKRNNELLAAKTKAPSTPETVPTEDDDESDGNTLISSSSAETGARARPAWCQTEKEREASEVATRHEEECRLLDFVDSLDFDQYSEDLELQTLIGQVKQRIKAIELENKKDATKLQTCVDSENAALQAETLGDVPIVDTLPMPVDPDEPEEGFDDATSVAESVMSQSTIGSIHSKKSLSTLVLRAREQIEMPQIDEDGREDCVPLPVCSTVPDDNGAKLIEKNAVSKLPFLRRNPSVP